MSTMGTLDTLGTHHSLLSVSHLSVRFGGLTAVDDLSFDLNAGELLGLIGPNGAGKTTALRAITGVVKLSEGTIRLAGCALNTLAIHQRVRRGLALSQQLVRPLREISVIENVMMSAAQAKTGHPLRALCHVSGTQERLIALEKLNAVGIAEYAEKSPQGLSLGILKRMEMARALALSPQLLLLDEPLAGLNSVEARRLADTIATINAEGMSIVLIEHNLNEVMRICQRLVVLDNGRKIADGEPRSVMSDPKVRTAYLGGEVSSTEVADEKGAVHA